MTPNSNQVLTLLAMTPAGEAVLIGEERRTSLIKLTTKGRARTDATLEDVEIAVRRHGWLAINESFDSWEELDRHRIQVARETLRRFPDKRIQDYDRRRVEVVLKQVARSGVDHPLVAAKLLTSLLAQCPAVYGDDQLRERIREQLDTLVDAWVQRGSNMAPLSTPRQELTRLDLAHGLDQDAA